jgi:hypothetical protein
VTVFISINYNEIAVSLSAAPVLHIGIYICNTPCGFAAASKVMCLDDRG